MEPEVWIFGALIVIELIRLWFKIIFIVLFTSWKKQNWFYQINPHQRQLMFKTSKIKTLQDQKFKINGCNFAFCFIFSGFKSLWCPERKCFCQESFYFRLLWLKTMVKLILRRSHSTVQCWETLVAIFINDLRECSLRRNLSQPLKIIFICGKTPSNYSSSERKCLCIVIQENMIRNKF